MPTANERRKHHRFPVVEGLIEPITLRLTPRAQGQPAYQPAILADLSSGGMSLVTFTSIPKTRKLELQLNLPGMLHIPLQGRIRRIHEKEEVYILGIQFTRIRKKDRHLIHCMAQDFQDCETRIHFNLPEACVPNCSFYPLCRKPQKVHWHQKKKG